MLINQHTKIAALLKHHPGALEAIITLSPDFKKLRNPILRKLMAGRTSISMASKIGGCKPKDFFRSLAPLGFETDDTIPAGEEAELPKKSVQQFIRDIKTAHIVVLDVRELLAGGNDPLNLIQQHIKELKEGQVLKIVNTFEPTPLIMLLEKQGFKSYVDPIKNDLVETYFYKTSAVKETVPETAADERDDWDKILKQFENRLEDIDVRHLEMPRPMMAILEKLEILPPDKALYVHHKRIPVFLLTELKDRKFDYRIKVADSGVFLLIFKP